MTIARSLVAPVAFVAIALAGAGPVHGAGEAVGMPFDLSADYPSGSEYMGIRLLGSLRLDAVDVDGLYRLHGLSALGFDEDADRLLALSDRGILFHLRLEFDDARLVQAYVLEAFPLRGAHGRPLTGDLADSEGMALRNARNGVAGDTQMLVSFERRARISAFDVRGKLLHHVRLPQPLRDSVAYRAANRGLEALADHPRVGLVVAPEQPLTGAPPEIRLFGVESSLSWSYPQPPEPNHALVDLHALPDGSLLALERAYGSIMFVPFITILRRIPGLPEAGGRLVSPPVVARFSTGQGFALDNFEGLTRHLGQRFLMVSDDNAKTYQSTLLVHFELLDPSRIDAPRSTPVTGDDAPRSRASH